MARVVWSDEAVADLDEIITYIDRFDPAAALRYQAKLVELGDSLITFPNRGRPAARGIRELTAVPPYVLRYEVDGEQSRILAIRHGRRRPLD